MSIVKKVCNSVDSRAELNGALNTPWRLGIPPLLFQGKVPQPAHVPFYLSANFGRNSALLPGTQTSLAPNRQEISCINRGPPTPFYLFSSSYLPSWKSRDQAGGFLQDEPSIAQRGGETCRVSFGALAGAIFDGLPHFRGIFFSSMLLLYAVDWGRELPLGF